MVQGDVSGPLPGTIRAGGRTARVRTSVLNATLRELAECGYSALSVERIAERSGVHKTTIYRRWRTKEAVLATAIAELVEQMFPVRVTDSIETDLRGAGHALVDLLTSDSPLVLGVMRAFFSEAASDPRIGGFKREFYARRHRQAQAMVVAAVNRGELPEDTDPDQVISLVMAPLYYRVLVTEERIDHEYADRLVDSALAAASAGRCGVPLGRNG